MRTSKIATNTRVMAYVLEIAILSILKKVQFDEKLK